MMNRQNKAANDARALKDVSQTFLNNDRHNRTSHVLGIGPNAQSCRYEHISLAEAGDIDLVDEKEDYFDEGPKALNSQHNQSCKVRGGTLDRPMNRKMM